MTTFRFAQPQTVNSSQARCSMRWVLTTVFGSRPAGSFFCEDSLALSAARRVRFIASMGWPIAGSSAACLRWHRTVS
jgi:hypothetical protein